MLIQAAEEWEAGGFRPDAMPSPEDFRRRNLPWRQQVTHMHYYLEWMRKQMETQTVNDMRGTPEEPSEQPA